MRHSTLKSLRVGYAPYDPSLRAPGDRRRFCFYAAEREIDFELARPDRDYDVVIVSARGDISAWRRYRPGKSKVVYDLVDSYLASPFSVKSAGRGLVKFAARETSRPMLSYRRAIEAMCRRSDAVVCSTTEQRSQIGRLCPNVHEILDHQSHLVTTVKRDYDAGSGFKFGWEGLPYTLDAFNTIREPLRAASGDGGSMHLVTDLEFRRFAGRFRRVRTATLADALFDRAYLYQWNEAMLARILTGCDLALVPLDLSDPFAAGKPENKLLVFWRMGVPAVVSATPSYTRAMNGAGVDGLCRTPADWVENLGRMMEDAGARKDAGERGREWAEDHHSDERILARWDAMFESL